MFDIRESDRIGQGLAPDFNGKAIAFGGIELFGIIDAGNARARPEYHRGGGYRARHGAHAGLINAGNTLHSRTPERGLKAE